MKDFQVWYRGERTTIYIIYIYITLHGDPLRALRVELGSV